MFGFDYGAETRRVSKLIEDNGIIDERRYIEKEIQRFIASDKRRNMLTAVRYYKGEHDILKRKRRVIGEGGELMEVKNLPNSRVVDNQYARLVDQKNNYLLSKPVTLFCKNKKYIRRINEVLKDDFWRLLKNVGEDCINCGIGWIYPYYLEGKLCFKRFRPSEILPIWKDEEHTELEMAIRVYQLQGYEGEKEVLYTRVQVYKKEGVESYELQGRRLIPEGKGVTPYITDSEGTGFCWGEIPLLPFKLNSTEIGLIQRVKGLQDALNELKNDFINNMQEDARNTILVLKNYDGTNLGEFRENLSQYGVVKVKTVDGADGGVDTLKIDVDSESYLSLIDLIKKSIIENARGYDCKDDRMSNNPNELNIRSMYGEIDLDANAMEMEFRLGLKNILRFVNSDIRAKFGEDYSKEDIDIIFNRDQLINESEVIENCNKSLGLLSRDTVASMHPWVKDVERECDS